MSSDLSKDVEALLFSIGKRVSVADLAKICGVGADDISNACRSVKQKYADHEVIHVVEDGDFWKMTIREDYLPVVQNVVTETELDKQTMETLAVIAFKNPALQADVIKIRTNKAYDHMKVLEDLGYIVREKFGRTMSIKLTPKFFEYFDLPSDKMKEMFNSFHDVEKAIDAKESDLKTLRQEVIVREEQERLEREKQRESEENFDQKISDVEDQYDLDVGSVEGEEVGVAGEEEVEKEVPQKEKNDGGSEEESSHKEVSDDEDVSGDVSEVQEQDEVSDTESDEKE